jgi:CRISPR-associated protein Cmr5
MSGTRRTLEQERAAHALGCVRALEEKGQGGYGNYRSYVERLPAQIVMNGLGQAMSMVRSRDPKHGSGKERESEDARAYRLLYEHMQGWLCGTHEAAPSRGKACLITAIIEQDQDTYVRAHAEALVYLEWLKKFARAFLSRGKEAE